MATDNKTDILSIIIPEEELHSKNVSDFLEKCIEMTKLYAKKNHDYGNSFDQGMNTIGMSYGIGRIYDKVNRIITLLKVKAEITDESIEDTINDLACYAVMTAMYIKNKKASIINDVNFE